MGEEVIAAVWREKFDSLNGNIERLAVVTDRLTKAFERVAVLEERQATHAAATTRAFTEIEKLQAAALEADKKNLREIEKLELAASEIEKRNGKDHDAFKRYIYLASGFVIACVAFWSVFGYHIQKVIERQDEAIFEMIAHTREDRVKSAEDVRVIIRGVQANAKP